MGLRIKGDLFCPAPNWMHATKKIPRSEGNKLSSLLKRSLLFFFCWWPFVQPKGIFTFPLAGIGKQWANNYNLLPCCRLDAISPRRSFCFCAGKKNRREESESELCVKVVDFSLKVLSCLLNFLGTFVTTAEHKKMGRDRIGWLRIPPDGDAQKVALSWVDSINFHLNKNSFCFFSWQSDQGKRDCKHVLTHANAL